MNFLTTLYWKMLFNRSFGEKALPEFVLNVILSQFWFGWSNKKISKTEPKLAANLQSYFCRANYEVQKYRDRAQLAPSLAVHANYTIKKECFSTVQHSFFIV